MIFLTEAPRVKMIFSDRGAAGAEVRKIIFTRGAEVRKIIFTREKVDKQSFH